MRRHSGELFGKSSVQNLGGELDIQSIEEGVDKRDSLASALHNRK